MRGLLLDNFKPVQTLSLQLFPKRKTFEGVAFIVRKIIITLSAVPGRNQSKDLKAFRQNLIGLDNDMHVVLYVASHLIANFQFSVKSYCSFFPYDTNMTEQGYVQLQITEKADAAPGERVRAVGMCFYKPVKELIAGNS